MIPFQPAAKKKPSLPYYLLALLATIWGFCIIGCGGGQVTESDPHAGVSSRYLKQIRFAVQVGAFTNLDNAVRQTERLRNAGLNAYHYVDRSGIYKVRFGNYATKKSASRDAEFLRARGIIQDYYVVSPQLAAIGEGLRNELVRTAHSFIGIPYKWGGESRREGFDCSGLTMTVYQLNGLELPRTSRQQWQTGKPVTRRNLLKGDLVFFATGGGRRVSHVGIYTGDGRFIHAPRRGQTIRTASLANSYYSKHYLGARRYL